MADTRPKPEDGGARLRPTPPEQLKITALQAQRLAALSDVDARELEGLTVPEISEKFRFRIDPELLFFRTICGRVVKRDPATGIEQPVAYATVYVEDTDCSLLGYFPKLSPWGWYFPFKCRREVIAVKKTDRCGNFCIRVPRWDIDWILRWRRERICFPIIFERPTIADLIADLEPERRFPIPKPGPDPDPSWLLKVDRGQVLTAIEQRAGRDVARKVGGALARVSLGGQTARALDVLQEDAFETPFPPPLPEDMRLLDRNRFSKDEKTKGDAKNSEASDDALANTLAARLGFDVASLREVDLRRFIGPFRRCYDRLFPEWVPIVDVPDITLRVTQDIDGDGNEETIYSEGYFRVRWNAGPLPNVKLVASSAAISIPDCGETIPVPCGNVPEIVRAGRMPVRGDATMYDTSAGYAIRPNRPDPSGNPGDMLPSTDPAETPFWGTVPIFGCIDIETTATHYRIVDSYSADELSFTPFSPLLNQSWWVTRLDGSGTVTQYHHVVPDGNGWYPIALPAGSPHEWEPQNLLLDWNTRTAGNGKHILKIELGTPAGPLAVQPPTDTVAFHVDNERPNTTFAVEYRKNGVGPFLPLNFPCPLVRRGAAPQNVEFRVTFTASASHLRDVSVSGNGCGAGDILYASGAPATWYNPGLTSVAHWHVTVNDNTAVVTLFFTLAAAALQGAYSFSGFASSRAINPAGGDTGHLATPPYAYDHYDLYSAPSFAFAVIDAD